LMVPVGLAKIFQQYAPYVDPLTGTVYQYTTTVADPSYYSGYGSIDVSSFVGSGVYIRSILTSPSVDLNCPLVMTLIHPRYTGLSEPYVYPWQQDTSVVSAPTQVTLSSTLNSILSSSLDVVNSLFPVCVSVDDIPILAPDASLYCLIDEPNNIIMSPCADFSRSMAYMLGSTGIPATLIQSFLPYNKSFPVIRCNQNQTTSYYSKAQTLFNVYAFMTTHAEKWVNGKAKLLMERAGDLSGAYSFSYRSTEVSPVSPTSISRLVTQMIRSDAWNGTDSETQNMLYSFLLLLWNTYAIRMAPFASIPVYGSVDYYYLLTGVTGCVNLYLNTTYFYASSASNNQRVPPLWNQVLNEAGPIVVGKRVLFPNFSSDYVYNSSFPGGPALNTSWNSNTCLNSVGNVNVSVVPFGFNAGPLSSFNLTYPNSTTSYTTVVPPNQNSHLVAVSPVGSINSVLAASIYLNYYALRYPSTYSPARWVFPPESILGGPASFVVNIGTTTTLPMSWRNMYLNYTYVYSVEAVSEGLCIPAMDVACCVITSARQIYPSSTTVSDYWPFYMEMEDDNPQPFLNVQQALSTTPGSTYQDMVQAQSTVGNNPTLKGPTAVPTGSSSASLTKLPTKSRNNDGVWHWMKTQLNAVADGITSYADPNNSNTLSGLALMAGGYVVDEIRQQGRRQAQELGRQTMRFTMNMGVGAVTTAMAYFGHAMRRFMPNRQSNNTRYGGQLIHMGQVHNYEL